MTRHIKTLLTILLCLPLFAGCINDDKLGSANDEFEVDGSVDLEFVDIRKNQTQSIERVFESDLAKVTKEDDSEIRIDEAVQLPVSTTSAVSGRPSGCGHASGSCCSMTALTRSAGISAISNWEAATGSCWANAVNKSSGRGSSSCYAWPPEKCCSSTCTASVCVYGTPGILPPPPNLAAVLQGNSIKITWSASSCATDYNVYVNNIYQVSTPNKFWSIASPLPSTTYTIAVSAYRRAEESVQSTTSIDTGEMPVPVSISGPTVLSGTVSPEWTVNIPNTVQNYLIECTTQRGSEPSFTWQTTNPFISFSPGSTGQTLSIKVKVTAPGYSPGYATYSCLNAY